MQNLDELTTVVRKTLNNRTDLNDIIPDWVKMCEAEINRRLQISQMVGYFTLRTVNGQATVPDNVLTLKNIQIDDVNHPIIAASRSELDGLRKERGVPRRYSIQGRNILFYPNPGEATIEARASFKVSPISEEKGNYVLESFPDIYLYGTLKHSAPYLIEDERIGIWSAMFDRALEGANKQDRRFAVPVSPSIRPNHPVRVSHKR